MAFVSEMGFALMLPSMWYFCEKLGADEMFYGFVLALFSAGMFIAAPILGLWVTKTKYKIVLGVCMFIGFLGDLIYSFAPNKWVLLVGRLLAGVSAGMGGVIKSYFSEVTTARERTGVMTQLGVAGTLGFLIGPGIGAAFGFLPDIPISQKWGIEISFTKLTAPGLFSSLCFLSSLIVFLLFFQEPDHYGPQEEQGSLPLLQEEETSYSESHTNQKPDIPLMSAMNVMDALLYTGLVVYQTVAMPVTQKNYQWDVKENGLLWLGTAIFSSLSYTSIPYVTKKIHEATILLISTILLTIAFSIMIDWSDSLPLWRFLLGTAIVSLFFPLATTPLDTLYSKTLVGSPSFYFALFAFASALGRISAPVWAGSMDEHFPEMWVFVTTAAAQFTAGVLAMCIYKRVQKRVAQKEQEITDYYEDSTVFI